MFIFLAIVMGPACGFMLYALSQFWREARRTQRRPNVESCWIVTPAQEFPAVKPDGQRNVIFITQPLSRRSAQRDVA
jgi:hypothetical protein